jgi:hypothetical protein
LVDASYKCIHIGESTALEPLRKFVVVVEVFGARVIWLQAITISQSWRNVIAIHVFLNFPLKFLTSLKYAMEYV